MALCLYNTLTNKKEALKPIKENLVRIYACGPTVYSYVHIGNLRAYTFNDLLRRYIKYKGFKLKHAMNITDVDDKTIRDSQKEKKALKEFTEYYTEAFLEDLKTLNIELPEIMPKATETIPEMVQLVKNIQKNGYAYDHEGDIYFSIEKFITYGKLANLSDKNLKKNAGGRLTEDEYGKENIRDFALWKAYDKSDGDVFWETEIGKGRPGWHLECSAMSKKVLGQPFDIHTGGVDLIFPHHTNEIAQSESAYKKKFCNFFLHNEHLLVDGEKMAKSKGNFYTLRDLLDKGLNPVAIRYAFLSVHYRQQLNFSLEALKQIPNTLQRIYDFLDMLDEVNGKGIAIAKLVNDTRKKFEYEMDDDLNISGALGSIFEFINEVNKVKDKLSKDNVIKIKEFMCKLDSVLGIMKRDKIEIPDEVAKLAEQRLEARKNKDYILSDKLRDKIKGKGFLIEDKNDGYRLKVK
tara:strand:- start:477 stop:1865 length:1389 start_codon:yes stop_codon:yes gene_type:complete